MVCPAISWHSQSQIFQKQCQVPFSVCQRLQLKCKINNVVFAYTAYEYSANSLFIDFFVFIVTMDELLTIADDMRPYTADNMKIEVAPWIKDYVVDMDDLYTDLTLEKIHNKPRGEDVKTLKSYEELFEDCKSMVGTGSPAKRPRKSRKSKKVLMKGDPGMGKTT